MFFNRAFTALRFFLPCRSIMVASFADSFPSHGGAHQKNELIVFVYLTLSCFHSSLVGWGQMREGGIFV